MVEESRVGALCQSSCSVKVANGMEEDYRESHERVTVGWKDSNIPTLPIASAYITAMRAREKRAHV